VQQAKHGRLSLGQRAQDGRNPLPALGFDGFLVRQRVGGGKLVQQRPAAAGPRFLDRERVEAIQRRGHLVRVHRERVRDLMPRFPGEAARPAGVPLAVQGPSHRGCTGEGQIDPDPDPADRVGDEPDASLGIERFRRTHHPLVSLAHEVFQGQTEPPVLFRHPHHEPQVRRDQPLTRPRVAGPRGTRQLALLVGQEDGVAAEIREIEGEGRRAWFCCHPRPFGA
jgi:hypothetical protein